MNLHSTVLTSNSVWSSGILASGVFIFRSIVDLWRQLINWVMLCLQNMVLCLSYIRILHAKITIRQLTHSQPIKQSSIFVVLDVLREKKTPCRELQIRDNSYFLIIFFSKKLFWIFLVDTFVDLYLWYRLPYVYSPIGYKTENVWFMYDNYDT